MHILVYGINFTPELTGIGKYTGEMAEWLATRGHRVTVLTAPPYYPAWKVAQGYPAFRYRSEIVNGCRVVRCPLWVPFRPGGFKRIIHLLGFALASAPALFWLLRSRPEVVVTIAPALFCAPFAALATRLSRTPGWLHIQDFEVDAAFELGLLRGARLRRWVQAAECGLLRRFSVVSTVSGKMRERLLAKGVAAERAVLFPNWADTVTIRPMQEANPLRAELGLPDTAVVALYSGNMGKKQGLEILAEAARSLADKPDLVFVFCGNGAGRTELVSACAGLDNVRFLELQPVERLNALLNLADIHLLPQRADAADLVMPSKLTGMLASGRAVLATAAEGTQLASVLKDCGSVVPPGDTGAFAAALRQLASDHNLREQLGKAGRLYAERHLARDAVLRSFEAGLRELVDGVGKR